MRPAMEQPYARVATIGRNRSNLTTVPLLLPRRLLPANTHTQSHKQSAIGSNTEHRERQWRTTSKDGVCETGIRVVGALVGSCAPLLGWLACVLFSIQFLAPLWLGCLDVSNRSCEQRRRPDESRLWLASRCFAHVRVMVPSVRRGRRRCAFCAQAAPENLQCISETPFRSVFFFHVARISGGGVSDARGL